jgi:hypothetical protein
MLTPERAGLMALVFQHCLKVLEGSHEIFVPFKGSTQISFWVALECYDLEPTGIL